MVSGMGYSAPQWNVHQDTQRTRLAASSNSICYWAWMSLGLILRWIQSARQRLVDDVKFMTHATMLFHTALTSGVVGACFVPLSAPSPGMTSCEPTSVTLKICIARSPSECGAGPSYRSYVNCDALESLNQECRLCEPTGGRNCGRRCSCPYRLGSKSTRHRSARTPRTTSSRTIIVALAGRGQLYVWAARRPLAADVGNPVQCHLADGHGHARSPVHRTSHNRMKDETPILE